jgi:hypothetical protein
MKKSIVSGLVVLMFISLSFAQDTIKNRRFVLSGAEISLGSMLHYSFDFGISEYLTMIKDPNFEIANINEYLVDSHSSPEMTLRYYRNASTTLNLSLNFDLRNKSGAAFRGNPFFRVGLSYSNSDYHFFNSFTKSDVFAADSLTVSHGGQNQTYAIDSINLMTYSFGMQTKAIRLKADIMWRTDLGKRFRFYGGLGVAFGVSLQNEILMGYMQGGYFFYRANPDITGIVNALPNTYTAYKSTSYGNRFKSATIFDFSLTVPIGLEFQLGKKGIFQHANLFYEYTPTILMMKTKGVGMKYRLGSQTALGLRIKF